jgi:uncharacterized protein (TIGR02646 family)
MKGRIKTEPPPKLKAWLEAASDAWQPSYPFDDAEVRIEVRSALLQGQRGLCVYCGRRLDLSRPGNTYHVEHFWPRSRYKERGIDFSNLYLSCGQKDTRGNPAQTCGTKKDTWFDENFHIEPVYPDCTSRFHFDLNGKVSAKQDADISADNMISHLNLNHPELVKDRYDVNYLIDIGDLDLTDFWHAETETAESYAHVVFERFGAKIP